MNRTQTRSQIIPVKLDNGATLHVQATVLGGEQDIAVKIPSFDQIAGTIEGIAKSLSKTMERVKPQKASVEFGIEIAAESGNLTALLVKGSGTASLTVTLEWGSTESK